MSNSNIFEKIKEKFQKSNDNSPKPINTRPVSVQSKKPTNEELRKKLLDELSKREQPSKTTTNVIETPQASTIVSSVTETPKAPTTVSNVTEAPKAPTIVSSIEESAKIAKANGTEPNMRPGGISEHSKEEPKYINLFSLKDYMYSGWGISEYVMINKENGELFYEATQYDGQMAAQTWTLYKKALSIDEMHFLIKQYADSSAKKYLSLNQDNWQTFIK